MSAQVKPDQRWRPALERLVDGLDGALDIAHATGTTLGELLAEALWVLACEREVVVETAATEPPASRRAGAEAGALALTAQALVQCASDHAVYNQARARGHGPVWNYRTHASCSCGWEPPLDRPVPVHDHLRDVVGGRP